MAQAYTGYMPPARIPSWFRANPDGGMALFVFLRVRGKKGARFT